MGRKKTITLPEFIGLKTPVKVATFLGVSTGTVQFWKYLESCPTVMNAYALIVWSDGALSWESIFRPYALRKLALDGNREAGDELQKILKKLPTKREKKAITF